MERQRINPVWRRWPGDHQQFFPVSGSISNEQESLVPLHDGCRWKWFQYKESSISGWNSGKFRFQIYFQESKNLPNKQSITNAIEDELASLGRMVFILIGQVNATEQFSETINHALFNEIQIDPTLPNSLTVAQLYSSSEFTWRRIIAGRGWKGSPFTRQLFKPFHDAYIKLKKKCFASLQVPKPGEKVTVGFLDEVANALARQAAEYHTLFKTAALNWIRTRRNSTMCFESRMILKAMRSEFYACWWVFVTWSRLFSGWPFQRTTI